MDEQSHSPWCCNNCHTIFAGERVLDSMRKAEIAVLCAGYQPVLPDDYFEWFRCPECASGNVARMAPNDDHEPLEAVSVETAVDVANKEMGELRRELRKFLKLDRATPEDRNRCMELLWNICASVSRAAQLEREGPVALESGNPYFSGS
jgi:hypothetical protein